MNVRRHILYPKAACLGRKLPNVIGPQTPERKDTSYSWCTGLLPLGVFTLRKIHRMIESLLASLGKIEEE
jgi:hypothetical protein